MTSFMKITPTPFSKPAAMQLRPEAQRRARLLYYSALTAHMPTVLWTLHSMRVE